MATLYVALLLIPLLGFASLAIDLGRVRLARAQLQTAADAAARAGVSAVETAPAPSAATMRQRSVDLAALNTCLATPVRIDTAEVDVGQWDQVARRFTPLADANQSAANATRVRTYRTGTRHGAVPLLVAAAIGVENADIAATATAYITGGPRNLGIIGLDRVDLSNGAVLTDSYNAAVGPYNAATAGASGHVASNGDITFDSTTATINGDARPGIGHSVVSAGAGQVTGWTAPLDYTLTYPADATPAITKTSNNNDKIPAGAVDSNLNLMISNGSVTLPGGTAATPMRYYLNSIKLTGNAQLTIKAHAQVYVYGNNGVSLQGNARLFVVPDAVSGPPAAQIWCAGDLKFTPNTQANFDPTGAARPADLYLSVIAAGTKVSADSNARLAAHLYAPLSDLKAGNHFDFYGRIVAKTIDIGASGGKGGIHYDESITNNRPWFIRLVQ